MLCRIISILSIFALLVSCNDIAMQVPESRNDASVISTSSNKVRYEDIARLNNVPTKASRSENDSIQYIECIVGNHNDTLIYVYKNPAGGWTMYPADSRLPIILAQCDKGSYSEISENISAQAWIQTMAQDIATIKRLDDRQLNFTREEVENNKTFWRSISNPDDFIKDRTKNRSSRALGDNARPLYTGEYVYRNTVTYSQIYDSIPSLLRTDWRQGYPYNSSCPPYSGNYVGKPVAGCVAVAAAQTLYYLHYKLGIPVSAPSEISFIGTHSVYEIKNVTYSSEIWDEMIDNPSKAAPLIAHAGALVKTNYGITSSSAPLETAPTKLFTKYGISCKYASFNADTLRSSLLNKMPVILGAQGKPVNAGGIVGHAFVADRYRRTRIVKVSYYDWVYHFPDGQPQIVPYIPPQEVYSYSSPVIDMIGLNWGFGNRSDNPSAWFSVTGDWISNTNPPINWNINRVMIYGFKSI